MTPPVAVAVLAACGTSDPLPPSAGPLAVARMSLDLTRAVPATVTATDVVVSGGGLALDGTTEGSIEIAVTNALIGGRQLRLDADRYNEITAGDLEGVTSPSLGTRNSTVVLDAWRTYASSLSSAPTFPLGADGSTVARVASSGSLIQYVPIVAGEDYRLRFSADTTAVATDEVLFLTWSLHDVDLTTTTPKLIHDASVSRIAWRRIDTDQTVETSSTEPWYGPDRGAFSEHFRLLVPDCDDHVIYEGGTATSPDTVSRNACTAADGTVLTTEDQIVYLGLEFAVGGGTADLDDVTVEYERQLEIQVLDSAGVELQSSTMDAGFFVRPDPAIASLRVVLRSSRTDRGPLVRRVTVDDGAPLQVVVGTPLATFTEDRLGFTGGLPPLPEWYDRATVRSECLDPFAGDAAVNCWDLFADAGVSRWRTTPGAMPLTATLNADDTYTFARFETVDPSDRDQRLDEVIALTHLAEAADHGMAILAIVENDNTGAWTGAENSLTFWDPTTGALAPELDPTPGDATDDVDVGIDLVSAMAAYHAGQFDGATTYTFDDGTEVPLPAVDRWQVFVETNIAEPAWVDLQSDAQHAAMLVDAADALRTAAPDAVIETSLNPNNFAIVQTFDSAYLEAVWPLVSADAYDRFNFNTFNDGVTVQPEDFRGGYEALRAET